MGTDGSLAVDRDGVQHAQCWRLSKETLQRQMLNTSAGLGPSHLPGADLPFRASRSDDKLLFGLAHRLLPSATVGYLSVTSGLAAVAGLFSVLAADGDVTNAKNASKFQIEVRPSTGNILARSRALRRRCGACRLSDVQVKRPVEGCPVTRAVGPHPHPQLFDLPRSPPRFGQPTRRNRGGCDQTIGQVNE